MNLEPTTTLAPTTNGDDTASSSWFCGMCKNKPTTATISADVSAEFQIIVTEHAGSITWDGVPNVHLVGNWRRGHDEFLIPNAWLQAGGLS